MYLSDIMEADTKIRCNCTARLAHVELCDSENGLQLSMPHAVAEKLHTELGNALAQLHGQQFAEGRTADESYREAIGSRGG